MQSGQPQQPPHEIPSSSRHVREVPQFSGHAPGVLPRRLPPAREPLMQQQLLIASAFWCGNEILIVCELMVNPNASIVVSQHVRFFGAKWVLLPPPAA